MQECAGTTTMHSNNAEVSSLDGWMQMITGPIRGSLRFRYRLLNRMHPSQHVIAPGRYGLEEILHHNFVPSPSVMFRSGLHRQLPPWYFDIAPTTDWPLWVLAALSGDIVLLDRVMADYMLTPKSNFMSKGARFQWISRSCAEGVSFTILDGQRQKQNQSTPG